MTSPERMAVFSSHFLYTVGTPRLTGALSFMSSWMSVKLWKTSNAAAGERISSEKVSLYNEYVVRQSLGLILLPPMSIMYLSGSYKPAGSAVNLQFANSSLIALSM